MGIHSIIVIKNEKEQYLQYYDEKWNSYLFLNCKLPNGDDINAVKNKVANDLNIKQNIPESLSLLKLQRYKYNIISIIATLL